eukprot:CAMPEP_0117490110 /NCGR_PEP_ID=MMETSP0784-20121206/17382_1 /TAXON_ID=39447 /ORGANISM="" /LENGTH=33 /DNA_ID= /DNA_START= /DNA_END= /DNA_ORIENTATION=
MTPCRDVGIQPLSASTEAPASGYAAELYAMAHL